MNIFYSSAGSAKADKFSHAATIVMSFSLHLSLDISQESLVRRPLSADFVVADRGFFSM
jgi:hypothetical protein